MGQPEPSENTDAGPTEPGTYTRDLGDKLQKAFDGLLRCRSVDSFEEMAKKEKVIVTLDKLLEVFGGSWYEKSFDRQKPVWHKSQGGVLIIGFSCGGGHGGVWESSDVLVQKERGQKVYVNTVLLAASILLSGNNFSKTSLVSRCLNLGFISSANFGRIQKLYAIPAIQARTISLQEGILRIGGRNSGPLE